MFIGIVIIAAKFFEKENEETSRKFIHIMLSNWWFIAMYFFKDPIWAAVGPASFIIINYLSYKKNLIKVMERDKPDGLRHSLLCYFTILNGNLYIWNN